MEIPLILVSLAVVGYVCFRIAFEYDIDRNFLCLLAVEHALATLFYLSMEAGDFLKYFNEGLHYSEVGTFDYLRPGGGFVVFISHLLHSIGPFSMHGMFVLFSLCGFMGHIFLIATCRPYLQFPRDQYFYLLFLLPGLHVWTCALGKDSLIFLPLCYILFAVAQHRWPVIQLCLAFGLVFLIRPHVALFLVAAAFLASLFSSPTEGLSKQLIKCSVAAIVFLAILPVTQQFVELSSLELSSAQELIEKRAGYNQSGGGGVDLQSMSPPLRLATYMFRPLFIDSPNSLGLMASVENLYLLFLFCTFVFFGGVQWMFREPDYAILFAFFFVAIMWTVCGMTTANLGIALRHKVQFLPHFVFVYLVYRWKRKRDQEIFDDYQVGNDKATFDPLTS